MTQSKQNRIGSITKKPGNARILPRPVIAIGIILIALLLTACTPVIGKTQPVQTEWITLTQGVSVGQTFVAEYDGLSGIQIGLAPQTEGTGTIGLHLRSDPESTKDLATSGLSISRITSAGSYSFFFTPQDISRSQYYYIVMDVNGEGSVQVGAAPGNAYMEGSAYQNDSPLNQQLSFQIIYSIRRLGLGLVREFVEWIGILLISGFIFLLPGWGLLRLLWRDWDALTWMEKLGLSAGASLVIYPIFLLWTGLVGLHLGFFYAWIPPMIALGILAWYNRKIFTRRISPPQKSPISIRGLIRSVHLPSIPSITLFIVIIAVVFSRFWAIRTIDVPMWGDSYQHTVIAQLIVDHRGIFHSWQPYAELSTFTYHFGFHTAAAVFHWVTGFSLPRSVLWVGQVLNILAVFSLYPLAMKLSRNRWCGIMALIVAGLLAPMPMSYTNWGRYTQLAGQVVLSAAIYLLWTFMIPSERLEITDPQSDSRKDLFHIILISIVMGGLALTHFRVIIFAILFIVALFIVRFFERIDRQQWKSMIKRVFWVGLGGGIIFLPWFLNSFGGKILRNFSNQLTTPASAVPLETQSYNAIGSMLQYLPIGVWLLLPLAIAWGLWKQHKGFLLISLWSFLMLISANPAWLRLPGTGALSNFAIFIAAYIPASVLVGGAAGLLVDTYFSGEWRADINLSLSSGWKANLLRLGIVGVRKKTNLPKWADLAIGVLVLTLVIIGLQQRTKDIHPESNSLATRPDLRAATWIKDNLPPDATILVNSFFAYGGSLIVGSDGGWWLPVLSQRHTTLPPLNYGTEQGSQPGYKQQVNELAREIQDKGLTDSAVIDMLRTQQISHVYIGQLQGRVNYYGPYVFDPSQLATDPAYKVVYHQDRVWIFEIVQTP